MAREVDVEQYAEDVLAGRRTQLARAITLVESTHPDHQAPAQELLLKLMPHSGKAHRLGITGVPGVGKSTFIEALGTQLTGEGHKVAVLAVDPSSTRTGGSILGDKTRMAQLASEENAFVRPSPSAGTLGGVAKATRESMVLMEAAGFDVVIVETVGVGQSEITVSHMVDTFLLLTLARTGDQLQGIKKGVLELADLVAVNKADGPHEKDARAAARELAGALRMVQPASQSWKTPVLTCSAKTGAGMEELWKKVLEHREAMTASGELEQRRADQQLEWTWAMVRDQLLSDLTAKRAVADALPDIEQRVRSGELTAALGAQEILDRYRSPGE